MTALSSLSSDQIATICEVIAKLRPHGARRWDPPGIRAALAKVAHLDASNVLMAAIRLSQDRTAETPGQIAITNTECWREKPGSWTPKPTQCAVHGIQHAGICPSCRAEQVGGDGPTQPTQTPHLDPEVNTAFADELRDIVAKTKGDHE